MALARAVGVEDRLYSCDGNCSSSTLFTALMRLTCRRYGRNMNTTTSPTATMATNCRRTGVGNQKGTGS